MEEKVKEKIKELESQLDSMLRLISDTANDKYDDRLEKARIIIAHTKLMTFYKARLELLYALLKELNMEADNGK